jgi:hypothetical protein
MLFIRVDGRDLLIWLEHASASVSHEYLVHALALASPILSPFAIPLRYTGPMLLDEKASGALEAS